MSDHKKLKVGVKKGGGPHPGYEWNALIVDEAHKEAVGMFTSAQYSHMAMQVKELASERDPTHSPVLSVRHMEGEGFHELRDKGGVFGKMNVRLFFGMDKKSHSIVVLGVIKKQNDGPTPQGDKIRMRRRWRKYQNGDYGEP